MACKIVAMHADLPPVPSRPAMNEWRTKKIRRDHSVSADVRKGRIDLILGVACLYCENYLSPIFFRISFDTTFLFTMISMVLYSTNGREK